MTKITSASKKVLSLALAMLLAFSCMAVAASADHSFTPIKLDDSNCVLDPEKKTITVSKATITIDEQETEVRFLIDDEAVSQALDNDLNTLFFNLSEGKKYTITAVVTVGEEEITVSEAPYTIALKNGQPAPDEPVPEKVMARSITVKPVTGAEYACVLFGSNESPVYSDDNVFKGLSPKTRYTIYLRYKETEKAYASPAATISQETKEASDQTVPEKPVLLDKTNTSIMVFNVAGQEYSIDGGKTWQSSNAFNNLEPDTDYVIVTRKIFDASLQEPTPISEGVAIKTTKRTAFVSSINKCNLIVKSSDPIYVETEFTFFAQGDTLASAEFVYGDTRYVPKSFSTSQTGTNEFTFDANGEAKFVAPSEGSLKVVVTYSFEKYNGTNWVDLGDAQLTFDFSVGSKGAKALDGVKKLFSVLLDKIPAAINKFLKSGIIKKIIQAIGNIGK